MFVIEEKTTTNNIGISKVGEVGSAYWGYIASSAKGAMKVYAQNNNGNFELYRPGANPAVWEGDAERLDEEMYNIAVRIAERNAEASGLEIGNLTGKLKETIS